MAPRTKDRKHTWSLTMNDSSRGGSDLARAEEKSLGVLGFNPNTVEEEAKGAQANSGKLIQLREAKAWEIAQSPMKAIPMNIFMMWMMGSTMQIFTMIMLVMAFVGPIKGLGTVRQTFSPLGTDQSFNLQKLTYLALNVLSLCVPLYKANSLGLMPSAADWLFYEPLDMLATPNEPNTCMTFKLNDEDHTLGNSLRYIIMKNPDTEFCGYTVPHPSDECIKLRIQTRNGVPAVDVFKKGLKDLEEVCKHTEKVFLQAVGEYREAHPMEE